MERTAMSGLEVDRAAVCVRVVAGEWSLAAAAKRLGLSYRQMKRLVQRYRRRGAAGLVHGNVGRRSNRAQPLLVLKTRSLELIRAHYSGTESERLGPTLAAEQLLREHGYSVEVETLRRWMLAEGLWSRRRKRRPYRQWRQRRAHFGELVQLDGSFHHWLGRERAKACLLLMIDDATGRTLARFAPEETVWAAAALLEEWVKCYGIPQALYTDGGTLYHNIHCERPTQFGGMCERLGVKLMRAWSPQAKGRVERAYGTHQDRLVKKLRLSGITDYERAAEFLPGYLAEHNERYAKAPREAEDFHLPLDGERDLRRIFCTVTERIVAQDWLVRHSCRAFQLPRSTAEIARPGSVVRVEESADRSVSLWTRDGQPLTWSERIGAALRSTPKPARSHPWRSSTLSAHFHQQLLEQTR